MQQSLEVNDPEGSNTTNAGQRAPGYEEQHHFDMLGPGSCSEQDDHRQRGGMPGGWMPRR